MDTSETPTDQRPTWACLLHCPPSDDTRAWARADPGYRTCSDCLNRLRERLTEVADRYAELDSTPGASAGGGRGAPGFGSRSPASEHVIAMTDARSSVVAKVWVAGDKRVHCESERPPLSVRGELETVAWEIAEASGIAARPAERSDVAMLVRWIDGRLDWVTRQDQVLLDLDAVIRRLLAQLRPATGQPRPSYIGHCPNVLDYAPDLGWAPAYEEDAGVPILCGVRLYAPIKGDTIRCRNEECRAVWRRQDWLQLGDLMAVA